MAVMARGSLRVYLGAAPGVGKTRTALAAAAILGSKRTLVVCPSMVITHWTREAMESGLGRHAGEVLSGAPPCADLVPPESAHLDNAPDNTSVTTGATTPNVVAMVAGRKIPEFPDRGVLIVGAQFIRSRADLDQAVRSWCPTVFICDEAHLARTWGSQTSRVLRRIARSAPVVIPTTGTPVLASPLELAPLLDMVGVLAPVYGDILEFRSHFTRRTKWGYTPIKKRLPELRHTLDHGVWIKRTKDDVLADLPPKSRRTLWVDIPGSWYETALASVVAQIDEWITMVMDAAGKPPSDDDIAEWVETSRGMVAQLRRAAGEVKVPAAVGVITEWFGDGADALPHPLVVWTHHHAVTLALVDALNASDITWPGDGVSVIDGTVDHERRAEIVDRFQDGQVPVLICSIQAAGVGITLTRSREALFVETDWTPAMVLQAEDRCVTDGQPIVTTRGIVPVEQVLVGDRVLNKDGQWTPVVDRWSRLYDGPLTTVRYVGGAAEPLVTTYDHDVLARRDGNVAWIQAHRLLPGDELFTPRAPWGNGVVLKVSGRDPLGDEWTTCRCGSTSIVGWGLCASCYSHDKSRGILDRPGRRRPNGRRVFLPETIPVDDDVSFVIGWYLAEGFASTAPGKGRFISLSGHEKERPVLEWCGRWFDRFGINWTISTTPTSLAIELRAYSAELAYTFAELFGHGAHSKRLPGEWLADLTKRQALVLLDAYYAGDGYHRPPEHEAVTASASLAWSIAMLTERLGVRALLRNGSVASGSHHIVAYNEATTDGFRRVRSVTTAHGRRVRVHDLTVKDGESFTVGFAAVHNCHRVGQKSPVTYTTLIAAGTLDERVHAVLSTKAGIVESVMGGDHQVFAPVTERMLATDVLTGMVRERLALLMTSKRTGVAA